jgi:histidine ammonia-lyase
MMNEVIEAFDDSFSKQLNAVKHHKGQQVIAQQMRDFVAGSQMIRSREELV